MVALSNKNLKYVSFTPPSRWQLVLSRCKVSYQSADFPRIHGEIIDFGSTIFKRDFYIGKRIVEQNLNKKMTDLILVFSPNNSSTNTVAWLMP